jgi:hypothetical protein
VSSILLDRLTRPAASPLPFPGTFGAARVSLARGNGRTLSDDTGDVFLAVATNGKVTDDKIGAHGDLLAEFPYLGPPHNAPRDQATRSRK